MKCETCIINATCGKKHYDDSLCDSMFEKVLEKIENLRKEADDLEHEYGLEYYFFQKRTEGKDPSEVYGLLEKGYKL